MKNEIKIEFKNDKKGKYQSQEIHIDMNIDYNNFYLSEYGRDIEEAIGNAIKALDNIKEQANRIKELLKTVNEEDCVKSL